MSDTVYIVLDRWDSTIYSVFAYETDAKQYVKKNDPDELSMVIEAWVVHNNLTCKIMDEMDEDYPDILDNVDETSYDPFCGCDMFETDEMW